MRKFLLFMVVLVLLALTLGGGYAIGLVHGTTGSLQVPGLLGNSPNGIPQFAPEAEWSYPDSESRGSTSGFTSELTIAGETQKLGVAQCSARITKDDFDTVYAHYSQLVTRLSSLDQDVANDPVPAELGLGAVGAGSTFQYSSATGATGTCFFYLDGTRGMYNDKIAERYQRRGVRMATLGLRRRGAFTTVVITRAKSDDVTHIQIVRDYSGQESPPR